LLRHTKHTPSFVAGGSAGSLASLRFALTYPGEVKGLIVIAPPSDSPEMWQMIATETFLKRATLAEQHGMAAALEAEGGSWDFFAWPDQFARMPHKKQQLLAMNPQDFAAAMRTWADSIMRGERPHLAGLRDEQLAAIKIPAIVFSGLDEVHPQHSAETLHGRLGQSTLVVSTQHYARDLEQIVHDMATKGPESFDVALVGRIHEFVQAVAATHQGQAR
jgi:pimeloyl-ACP methyl ester carboxylesterase